jgi:hypothetical protein
MRRQLRAEPWWWLLLFMQSRHESREYSCYRRWHREDRYA